MKSPIAMLSRPQPAGESVARRLLWGQSIAPQIASNFGAGELTHLSSTYRIIYLHRFPVACSGAPHTHSEKAVNTEITLSGLSKES